MVQYNLKNREYELNTTPDLYGLYIRNDKKWMKRFDAIGTYDILKEAFNYTFVL
jgi:hypothetical protein